MNTLRNNLLYLRSIKPQWFDGFGEDLLISQLESLCERSGLNLQNLLLYNLSAREMPWEKLRFMFLDVDGVLTEGGMYYTEGGHEFKRFDTKDGMAIKEAMKAGIRFGIISSGVNHDIIQHRADMFGIQHVYVGTEPKLKIAERWLKELGLKWEETGHVGDDINDLSLLEHAGIAACPSDATVPVKERADFVLQSSGGHGCIREFMAYLPALKDVL